MFRAYDPARDRLVAVKVFRLDLTPEQVRAVATELQHAIEAEVRHYAMAALIAAGVEESLPYLVEEFVAGESVDVWIRQEGRRSAEHVMPLVDHLAGALDVAADAGILHGALHPRDVLVSDGRARGTGFGITRALERVGLRAPVRRPYCAPERIEGAPWDVTADVFALAAIAYELLTGQRIAGTGRQFAGRLHATQDDLAWEECAEVFATALADDPASRYASARTFAHAARSVVTHVDLRPSSRDSARPAPQNVGLPFDLSEAPEEVAAAPRLDAPPGWDDQVLGRGEPEPELELDAEAEREGAPESGPEPEFTYQPAPEPESELEPARALEPEPEAKLEPEPEPEREREPAPEREQQVSLPSPVLAGPAAEPPGVVERAAAAELEGSPAAGGPARVNEAEEPSASEARLFTALTGVAAGAAASREEEPSRSAPPRLAAFLILIAIAFGAGYLTGTRSARRPASAPLAQQPPQAPAASTRAGQEWSEGSLPVGAPAAVEKPTEPPPPPPEAPIGRVLVRSTPGGAAVRVNGERRGTTPLALRDLPLGTYTISVSRSGFASQEQRVTLSAREPSAALTFTLARPPARAQPIASGSISVESRPAGARVLIDGRLAGVTPLVVPRVSAGDHMVVIEREGYRRWSTTVRVAPGRRERVAASLDRGP